MGLVRVQPLNLWKMEVLVIVKTRKGCSFQQVRPFLEGEDDG